MTGRPAGVVLAFAVVVKQTVGMHALTVLDAAAWRGLAVDLLVAVVSPFVCVLLGIAAGASRSMAVAVAAAVGFFPVDNGLVPFLSVLSDATGKRVWNDLTGYLLGPTLNHLPIAPLRPACRHRGTCLAVYCAVLVVVAVVPTWRRDVLE